MIMETLRFALGGVAAYRHILDTHELGLVRTLLDKLALGDTAGAAEAYASLFYTLREGRYPGLGDWLYDQLRPGWPRRAGQTPPWRRPPAGTWPFSPSCVSWTAGSSSPP